MTREISPWWLAIRRVPRPRVRLVCLPWAGGAAAAFRPWAARLPPDVELWAAQLPGRGPRFGEPPVSRLGTLLDALEPALRPLADVPYALFGHSMGAIVAFELAARAVAPPAHLFVSAARAPGHPAGRDDLHPLPDDELERRLAALGGMPEEIRRERELMALMLPTIRADLAALETWTSPPRPPLPVPITALGGLDDAVPRAALEAWRERTTSAFALHLFPGGHFYLLEQEAALLEHLAGTLATG
jgi:medium-chain acyl-[acyl-carrier-protein] hydrolase